MVGRRLLIGTLIAAGAVGASASPAAAHGIGGAQPTNYETTVDPVTVEGLHVDTVDVGSKLRVRNDTGETLVILGYEGEPYLRLDDDGVFENRRSPAVYLNRSQDLANPVPASADATAEPDWRRVSGGDRVTFHWHSAHYMGSEEPPGVQDDRGRRQVVQEWTLDVRVGDQRAAISGDVVWVPPPSPWPWIALAAVLALAVLLASRLRRWVPVVWAALAIVMLAEAVHVVGNWGATTDSAATKLFASVYSVGGIAIGIVALVLLSRADPSSAIPAVLLAGVVLAIAGGFADITSLTRSQLATTLPAWLARLDVTIALGLGTGVAAAAAIRLRTPTAPPTTSAVQSEA